MKKDPKVEAFLKDFSDQVIKRLREKSKVTMGFDFREFKTVVTGEVAVGLIHPKPDVLGVLTIGKITDAVATDKMLAKIKSKLLEQKGIIEKAALSEGTARVAHFEFPDPFGIAGPPQVFYGRSDEWLISYYGPVLPGTDKSDHVAEIQNLLKSLHGGGNGSLADQTNYRKIRERIVTDKSFETYEVHWFAEAFGFIDAAAKIWPEQFGGRNFGALRKVGFDAVKAFGGIAKIENGKRESMFRAFVYAPPVSATQRFEKAAKVLDFTDKTSRHSQVPNWVSETSTSYLSMHGRMLNAFDNVESLVDEIYGENVYKNTMENFKNNPRLKQNFNVRKELAELLGNRVVAARDPQLPPKKENQRVVFGIEIAKDQPIVKKMIWKYLQNEDPNFVKSKKIVVGDKKEEVEIHILITPPDDDGGPEEIPIDDLDLDLDEPEVDPKLDAKKKDGEPVIKQICIAVYGNYILVSPDIVFIEEVIRRGGAKQPSKLNQQPWVMAVNQELDKLKSSSFESLRFVLRLDRPYKAAYELVLNSKSGDLPIESVLKKIFNEEGDKPLFDRSKLPKNFDDSFGKHLNHLGWSMTTESDGWMFNGVIVEK